ncbi:MAG: SDR family oxidoreductase [Betaproteobacteria bacterium]|nr:SDR family oxidoreductase [Betaproteobacteria bacterium]
MDLNLKGRAVLITGGSKGIGFACAHAFLGEGARVAISSRDPANLDRAAKQLADSGYEVATFPADFIDPTAAVRVVREAEAVIGPIDILVNSAGAAKRAPPEDLTPEVWRAAMDAKYFTYIHAIDAVIKGMLARGHGVIVNIVGTGGKVATPMHLTGGAANAALMLVSAGLAHTWARHGVRVNAINPGHTHTERTQELLELEARMSGRPVAALREENARRIPIGRYARPAEIADAALFLASERSSYITGAILTMDGGLNPVVV